MTKLITDEVKFDFDVYPLYVGDVDFDDHSAMDVGVNFNFDVELIGEGIEGYSGHVYLVEYDEHELERVNNIIIERNNIMDKLYACKTLRELEENLKNELDWDGEKDVEEEDDNIGENISYYVLDKKTLLGKANDGIYWNITAELSNSGLVGVHIEFKEK